MQGVYTHLKNVGVRGLTLLVRMQSDVPRHRRSVDGGRATVRHGRSSKAGNTFVLDAQVAVVTRSGAQSRLQCTLHCSCMLQDIAQAMLRQMQHIQHAGGDPTAEELRFSTADLLQAMKVQMTGLLPGLFNPAGIMNHSLLLSPFLPLILC